MAERRVEVDTSGMGIVVRLIEDGVMVKSLAAVERGGDYLEDIVFACGWEIQRLRELLADVARTAISVAGTGGGSWYISKDLRDRVKEVALG